MLKNKNILHAAIALLMFSSGARAQFLWEVTHSGSDARYSYCFQAFSNSGNNCTAAGMLIDNLRHTQNLMFWHSTDGGRNWNMQDPNTPYYSWGFNNQFSFIQQIDSLNVVAIGRFGLIFRTFDGGNTWEKQDCQTTKDINDVNFSSPMEGVVTTQDPVHSILVTTDGGKHWDTNNNIISLLDMWGCHSFASGKFSVFQRGIGPIWTTSDNWQSVQSSNPIIDKRYDSTWDNYYFSACQFNGKDTIIATGTYTLPGSFIAIARSIDGGKNWEKPSLFFNNIEFITCMSAPDRDTVLAGTFPDNLILMSTDRGKTWRTDSLMFNINISPNYPIQSCYGIGWSDGSPVAAFGIDPFSPGILVRGTVLKSLVKEGMSVQTAAVIFPNPASSQVTIHTGSVSRTVYIFDILGREVRRGISAENGMATFDIRSLPKAIYNAYVSMDGQRECVGKFIVNGE